MSVYGQINLNMSEDDVIVRDRSIQDRADTVKQMSQEDLLLNHSQTMLITQRYRKAALKNNSKDITIMSIANDGRNQAFTFQDNILKASTKERNAVQQYDPSFDALKEAEKMYGSKSSITNEKVNNNGALLGELQASLDLADDDTVTDNERVELPGPAISTEDLVGGQQGLNPDDRQRWDDAVDKLFGNPNNDTAKAIRECIPCGLREIDPIAFELRTTSPFEGIADRLEALLGNISGAAGETEGLDDLCRLLSIFDVACIPDLFSLISLFTLLQTRYLTELELSIDGLMSAIIGVLLGPMLTNITSTLDQFIDSIMNPLKCVVQALENQLAKIDLEAAADKSKQIRRQYERRRNEFLRSKKRSLLARRQELSTQPLNRQPRFTQGVERGALADVVRDTGELLVDNYDAMREQQRTNSPTGRLDNLSPSQRRDNQLADVRGTERTDLQKAGYTLVDGKYYENGLDAERAGEYERRQKAFGDKIDQNLNRKAAVPLKRPTVGEEIAKIDQEVARIDAEIGGTPQYGSAWGSLGTSYIQKGADKVSDYAYKGIDAAGDNIVARGISNARRGLRAGLSDIQAAQTFAKTSLQTIIEGIYEGQDVINTLLDTMIDELKRTMFGRIETQEDQLQLMRTLQRYTRLIGFCKALIEMSKNRDDFKEKCENRQGFGNFISAYRKVNENDGFTVYHGQAAGEDVLVLAPQNARVKVTGFEKSDALDPSGEVGLLTEKTSEYNANNEISELNRKGVLPDLGDISASKIEVEFNGAAKDLNISDNYVIMVNNFCSQINGGEGSVDAVKNWVNNL